MANFNRGNRFSGGRDFNRRGFSGDSRGPVQMHQAVCDNCGKNCEVPFRPTSGKPVYCSNCFGEKKEAGESRNRQYQPEYKEQFEALNNKLDKILQLLEAAKETKVAKKSLKSL